MKHLIVFTFTMATLAIHAQVPTDSLSSAHSDSIAYNTELDEVVVKAQKQLIKNDIDRIGYDVEADEESETQTVMEMLKKVPLVTVDSEENIKVKGSANFRIYRNGHPDPSLTKNAKEILKAMPASTVKRIEVITDPGAREDAEGVNAILNIVMTDSSAMDGLTGSLTATYNTLQHPNANAFITTQIGKTILSIDYGYGGMSKRETENSITAQRKFIQTGNCSTTEGIGTNKGNVHFADINASYDIDSLNLLSASFSGYFYKLNVEGTRHHSITDATGNTLGSYDNRYLMPGYSHHSWNGRADYEHRTHLEGEKLTLSYMLALTRQNTTQEDEYTNIEGMTLGYDGSLFDTNENFTENTFQADWIRPINRHNKIETGAKYIFRDNKSRSIQTFYANDSPTLSGDDISPQQSDNDNLLRFNHDTHIAALYGDYHINYGKLSARAGLRYEHSIMRARYPDGKGEGFKRHLNDWVPQASVKLQIDDAQSLKLNYTTSISRPGIAYLNPKTVVTPETVDRGNPELVSSRQQSMQLIYMLIKPRLTLQLLPSYLWGNGGIGYVQYAVGNIAYHTYANIERKRKFGVESYVQWKPFDKTTIIGNYYIRKEQLSNRELSIKQSLWAANFYSMVTQTLPLKINMSVGCYGQIGHEVEDVYSYSRPWFRYYASLQRSFLKDDRLTVRLSTNMPFNKYTHYSSRTTQGDYTGFNDYTNRGQMFQASVTFRFGRLKASVKKTDTTIDNNDVVGGITRGK